MNGSYVSAHSLAALVITGGCLLAVVTAFEPQATRAWHLAGAWLVCGLLPYIVYGSFLTVLMDCALVTAGMLLLTADLVARTGFGFTAAAQPGPTAPYWLVTLLLIGVLPAGILTGKLLDALPVCRRSPNNPNASD